MFKGIDDPERAARCSETCAMRIMARDMRRWIISIGDARGFGFGGLCFLGTCFSRSLVKTNCGSTIEYSVCLHWATDMGFGFLLVFFVLHISFCFPPVAAAWQMYILT